MTPLTALATGLTTVLLAEPSGEATLPPSTVPEELVSPGVPGFIAMALVAVAVVLLVVDMTRRVRRTRYRGEVRERIAAERAAAAGGATSGAGDDAPPATDPR